MPETACFETLHRVVSGSFRIDSYAWSRYMLFQSGISWKSQSCRVVATLPDCQEVLQFQ